MPQELEDRITKASAAYHNAKKHKITTIAREFNLTSGMLRGRIHGKSRNERSGPNKALEPEQEKD
jgi:lipocalin